MNGRNAEIAFRSSGIVSTLRSARVNVLIPQPIQPSCAHYDRCQSHPTVRFGRNKVKVDKPHTAQSDKRQSYTQIYRSMQSAHKSNLVRLYLWSRPPNFKLTHYRQAFSTRSSSVDMAKQFGQLREVKGAATRCACVQNTTASCN
jgi:hypothetical protein